MSGYVCLYDGDWYKKEECIYCSECDNYVLEADYNCDEDMCNECWNNREED